MIGKFIKLHKKPSWNWVAMYKDRVIDNFPTKKKAMKFIELETLLENMQRELPND